VLAFFQTVPPGRREGAEIFSAEPLLALGKFSDQVIAFGLGFLIAVGGELGAGRKKCPMK
jgi:hypothetical protein